MPKEICILCGKETHEEITTHIDFRTGYVEGAGQLCIECYRKGNQSNRSHITIPEDYIKSYPNDMELGSKVRSFYYENYGTKQEVNKMTCSLCGDDTSNVDYDYLAGTDHISCILANEMKDR